MLKELHIKNFALIDEFRIEFQPGLNVLTGETGAGKSIIISALDLALGGRAGLECIREGEDSANVEALFLLNGKADLKALAERLGVSAEEDELIIKRTVSRSGKNKVFLNGSLAPLSALSEIGDRLADIHGQHQHQALFQSENHLRFLDAFGGLEPDCEEVRKLESLYRELKKQAERKEEKKRERARRKDQLNYEITEIQRAGLAPDEEETLLVEMKKLRNSEKIHEAVGNAYKGLYDSDDSALDILKQAHGGLSSAVEMDPGLASTLETSNSIIIQLDELSSGLRDYLGGIESNPEKLQEMEDRMAEIKSLKRKYGATIEEVLEYLEKAESEFAGLESEDEFSEKLEKELEEMEGKIQGKAEQLAADREKASKKFSSVITKELKDLNMDKVDFKVDFLYEPEEGGPFAFKGGQVKLNPHGFGRVEFLFSSNPGESPKPLSRIASGGEISRVMLALKNILPGSADVPTLVFDEVDTGIGGKVAEKVGEKLMKISRGRQVLCITHLPQIAGMAEAHYSIEKSFSGGRTKIAIRGLSKEERVDEIARMSGGSVITEATRRHAKEMIKG
ncbi:MAG: DNA repair protein RecN [Nitrospinae bacterium]|nr:DNA repair protein RecN [Nitrospinota bacterium]